MCSCSPTPRSRTRATPTTGGPWHPARTSTSWPPARPATGWWPPRSSGCGPAGAGSTTSRCAGRRTAPSWPRCAAAAGRSPGRSALAVVDRQRRALERRVQVRVGEPRAGLLADVEVDVAGPAEAGRELVGDRPAGRHEPPAHGVRGTVSTVEDGERGAGPQHVPVGGGRDERAQRPAGGVPGGRVQPVAGVRGPVQVLAGGDLPGSLALDRFDEVPRVRTEIVVPVHAVEDRAAGDRLGRLGVEGEDGGVVDARRPAG